MGLFIRWLRRGLVLGALPVIAACGGNTPEKSLASAQAYLAKNDAKAAVIQSKNALQARGDWAPARFVLGEALLESGDPASAVVELEKARELKHPDEEVLPVLARALVVLRDYKAVTERFASTKLALPAGTADLQTSLAISFLSLGERRSGERALAAALAANPSYIPAVVVQSRFEASEGRVDDALRLLDKALATAPSNVELLTLRGNILLFSKPERPGAVAAYRKALEARPDHLAAHTGLVMAALAGKDREAAARQIEALKKVLPNHLQTKFLASLVAFEHGDDKLAGELALQLLKVAPDDPRLLQIAGSVELRRGALLQAETYFQKALQVAPTSLAPRLLLSQTYVRAGQPAKALASLGPALEVDSPDPAAMSAAAQAHARAGDLILAESWYAKAAKQSPGDPRTRTALALTHLALGEVDASFGELHRIAQEDTGTTADLALIRAYLGRNQLALALEAIAALEKKTPGLAATSQLRGATHRGLNQPAQARKDFEQALERDAGFFPAIEGLAALDVADGKIDQAIKRFKAVLAKQPSNLPAQLAVAALSTRMGAKPEDVAKLLAKAIRTNPTEPMPRLKLIELHVLLRQWDAARNAAQEAVAALPASPELLDALGRVQALSGDANQARASFNKLASMLPQSPVPHVRLADVHSAAKNPDAAAQSLARALEIQPDFLEAQRKLALLETAARRYPAALKIAKTVQTQRPRQDAGFVMEGDVELARKDLDAAVNSYRAGLKAAPSAPLAMKLHATLVHTGKQGDADAVAAAWLKGHPEDTAFMNHLGLVALQQRSYVQAERQFAAVVQRAPRHAAALNNLAWSMVQQAKPLALEYATRANEITPNQPPIMETLALALSLNGKLPQAVELQKQVVQLQPGNNSFRLSLAKIYVLAGQPEQAKSELNLLSNLGDKFAGQPEVARMLKSL